MSESKLANYYQTIQEKGHIITERQTKRWSTAVLKSMGLNLGKGTKRALAKALPEELAHDLTRIFWLVHFRDVNLPATEFQTMVARRAGASDPQFAKHAIVAVFHALKQLIDNDTSKDVADSLSPELRELWQNA